MTLERKTTIGQIEILPETGHVQVRLHIQLYEDGAPIGSPHYHRTSVIEPDTDIDAHMKEVNGHLDGAKIGPPLAEWSDIHAHARVARKPELVAAHIKRKADALAKGKPGA